MAPGEVALGEVVVVDVCAVAIPIAPASIAAAINAVPVIPMRSYPLWVADQSRRASVVT
jgi:hypothetical protein